MLLNRRIVQSPLDFMHVRKGSPRRTVGSWGRGETSGPHVSNPGTTLQPYRHTPGARAGAGPGIRTKKAPTRISSRFHLLDMKRFDNHAHNTFLHRVTCPNKYHLRPNNLSFLRMRTVTEKVTLPNLGFSLLPRSDFTEPQYQPTGCL
jgi:hypothetical protein